VPAVAGVPILAGAVAQLGERVNGIHEVSGSIPLGSTNEINNLEKWRGGLPVLG
jgi:ribosomal protein S5